MHDEEQMYEVAYPAPAVRSDNDGANGPTLVIAMSGYADAGMAVETAADHLQAALETRELVSFNPDELVDYRSRRPAATISSNEPVSVDDANLSIQVLRDNAGRSFLLLSGPEPDIRWEAFTDSVADLVDRFGVKNTISLYAAPMPTPHTRPLVITGHGSKDLTNRMVTLDSTMIVPGSASLFIERELANRGRNAAGFTAHVPHYLASSPYPHAAYRLLESVEAAAGLDLPLRSLERDMERVNEQLAEQVGESEEVYHVVAQLEEQYDSFMEQYRKRHPQAIMPGEENMPSGEEISEEFQRFLAAFDSGDVDFSGFLPRTDLENLGDDTAGGTANSEKDDVAGLGHDEPPHRNDRDDTDRGESDGSRDDSQDGPAAP